MSASAFPSRREILLIVALVCGHTVWTLSCFTLAGWIDRNLDRYGWSTGYFYLDCAYSLCAGTVFAQLMLVVTWVALGSGSSLLRISGTTLVLFLAGYLLGLYLARLHGFPMTYGDLVAPILFALVAFFILQLPLWMLRFFWGWRLVASAQDALNAATPTRRLTIVHLLGWTAFVAAPLAMGQAFVFSEGGGIAQLLDLLVIAAIAFSVHLVFLWVLLSTQQRPVWLSAAIVIFVSGTGTAFAYIYAALKYGRMLNGEQWGFAIFGMTYCLLLAVTMVIARTSGFRLATANTAHASTNA